jgi:metal-sulfur cluster biosynthetic enzyme
MSMTIKSTRLPALLMEGDMVELGMSHEIKVDGDGTWVSLKMTTKVGVGETPDDAYQRVEQYLTEKMRMAVKAAVRNIEEMST